MISDSNEVGGKMTPAIELRRALGRWDLALLFVVAVLNLNTVPAIAGSGAISIWLWVAALMIFFLPEGIAVIELAQTYPGEGGLYLWSKEVFGDFHGFIAGWSYLSANVFFIPFTLLYFLGTVVYVGTPRMRAAMDNPLIAFASILGVLIVITAINVRGVELGKWISNFGGMGTLAFAIALVAMSAWAVRGHGSQLHLGDVLHSRLDWKVVSAFGAMCFSLTGLELASVMGDEIRDPRRTLPGAIGLSGVLCGLLYIATTASILSAIPSERIGAVQGTMQAATSITADIGQNWLVPLLASMLALSVLGVASAWLSGMARLPFVFGLDSYLPAALGKIHPRYQTPHVALIAQSCVCALFLGLSFAGAAVKEAFVTMLDLAAVLNLLPYLYIFAATLVLSQRARERGVFPIWALRIAGAMGFLVTLLAMGVLFVPSTQVGSPARFEMKMWFGTLFFVGLGCLLFWRGKRRLSDKRP